MSSRARRTLVATAPDGTEVTEQTSGNYDIAGLIQHEGGSWVIAAHGTSRASVQNRTSTLYNRGSYQAMHVSDLVELTVPVIREYFGTHHGLIVDAAYSSGTHEGLGESDARAVLYAAGASLDHMAGAIRQAMDHPGEKGHAGVQGSSGIIGISYSGGELTLERVVPDWYFIGLVGASATRSYLRHIARCGWTSVAIRHGERVADFQVSEIVKSMNARPDR
jgi:hypothetical protein